MVLNSDTLSDSSLYKVKITQWTLVLNNVNTNRKRAKTLDILPTALILFLMILRRSKAWAEAVVGDMEGSAASSASTSSSSSFVQQLRTATNISVTE